MASSIHIKKSTNGIIIHNTRDNFSNSVVFTDEENEVSHSKSEAYRTYRKELAIRSKAYSKRTKQKLQKNAITHLSAVVNLEQHHTLKDLENIKVHLENTLDTKVFQMSIHRDEGKLFDKENDIYLTSGEDFYKNPDNDKLYYDSKYTKEINMSKYEIQKNYHAHIEMMGLDSTGAGIKRSKLNTYYLSNLQTLVAQELNMERGINYKEENIKAPKRLDVLEFKRENTVKNKVKMATQRLLKSEIAEIRLQLQKEKAKKEKYQELDQLNRELKEQIKLKTLSEENLKEKISKIMSENSRFEDIYYDLRYQIYELEERVTLLKDRNKGSLGLNKTLRREIEKKSNEIDSFKLRLNALEEQNGILESKLSTEQEKGVYKQTTEELDPLDEALKEIEERERYQGINR